MTATLSVVNETADVELDGFRLRYVAEDGTQHRLSLADAWAVRFEAMAPARRYRARKGQRHLPGLWWSSTMGGHVGYESWLERDQVMWLDWDRAVVGIAAQPFWLSWTGLDGRDVAHAPDFFARKVDGSAVVVDCRPVDRRPERDLAKFEATRRACELMGWEYRLVGAADPIATANLRWLAGYRHPRHSVAGLAEALRAAFAEPVPLLASAEAVGDPIAMLPVLFHLLWRQDLTTDLSVPLHPHDRYHRRYQPGCGLMGGLARSVSRPGDWVRFDGGEHQVVAVAGTAVRLRSTTGGEQVVLAGYLMAAPEFAVVDGEPAPSVEPFGLLDSLSEEVLAEARDWERHVVEVETGLPPDAAPGSPSRPEFDPARTTLNERDAAKAAELRVSVRTIQSRRARYAQQGLWGLVDQRAVRTWEATGRADARLVTAIREALEAETHTSTGTRSRLVRRVVKAVEATHGPGVVPLPSRNTFYKLIDALSVGRHTFASAVTRRQTANRPAGPFTPSFAARPGEQVQIDSTPIDVMVLLESGMPARADLTVAVDVATRTVCAAVLRPVGTKAVDAALLLARMLVPEPMRPGWSVALRMSASRLPHARLLDVDARMELAAARPVIVPDTIVIDGGKVFVSETFTRACARLGVSVQNCRPGTPTDKGIVEATFDAINTLFCQHVTAYTGSNTQLRGDRVDAQAAWAVPDLQDLLDEWLLAGWQARPHDALRDPYFPRRAISPNDRYTALVAAAGYLPLALTGEDYLELLPVAWRQINDYGIRIDYRTYDSPELGPWRRQHSGVTAKRGLWEVHYDPYDLSQVFVRTRDGWVTAAWTHLPMISAPFADFTWRHARRLAAQAGRDDTNETEVARVLDELLTRAQAGPPVDKATARVAARTRVAAAAHRPPPAEEPLVEPDEEDELPTSTVVPMGIFDARAEAERWPY